ncbi:LLM class flavin-dependent oxidoreductase [Streptomyces sp. HNM0575]|uniref:LLM class flavin-dependent oxidoreductase n=1 Tax=Streptomyces sp. HNM0575 TaxID=2716338 RepID=UPI00145D6492|nr:LLM class flavin-dependent oxidoreductase [Streptomyces sp. HNM0575]NLU73406.1 LLM class flavin-dependent oxidoreductase [Streptomyces sp. HNM0575]
MRLAAALHGGTSAGGAELADDALRITWAARDAGYSAVVAGQHFLTGPRAYLQPLPLLSHLIPESGDMRLVAGVLLMPFLNPVQLAEELATLDVLSGGRLVVGAGQGYRQVEFDAFGVPREARLDAQLRTLDGLITLWLGGSPDGADAASGMRPVNEPYPPIWYAAGNRRAFTRAVDRGFTPFIGPQATPSAVAGLLSLAPRDGSVALRRDVLVTDTIGREAAERALRQRAEQYSEWGYTTADGSECPYLVGTADECRDGMRDLARAGVTDLVVRTNWPGVSGESSLDMLAAIGGPVTPADPAGPYTDARTHVPRPSERPARSSR